MRLRLARQRLDPAQVGCRRGRRGCGAATRSGRQRRRGARGARSGGRRRRRPRADAALRRRLWLGSRLRSRVPAAAPVLVFVVAPARSRRAAAASGRSASGGWLARRRRGGFRRQVRVPVVSPAPLVPACAEWAGATTQILALPPARSADFCIHYSRLWRWLGVLGEPLHTTHTWLGSGAMWMGVRCDLYQFLL
jgi:hypothetical protein